MQNYPIKALIFDVDGTLADTESYHLQAFNQAFAEVGMDWVWDVPGYTKLLEVSGGKERLLHYWRSVMPEIRDLNGQAINDAINQIHEIKTAIYTSLLNHGKVVLRPGVMALIEEALRAGIKLSIATTTTPANINALMKQNLGNDWRRDFSVVGDAHTSPNKKPDPQVYLYVLKMLRLDPDECIAFEDSGNGLSAAHQAGLRVVVTPTEFTRHHDFSKAMTVQEDLTTINLDLLTTYPVDKKLHLKRATPNQTS
ncbi:HAD-IA family hydrolase [Ampullimonas aquatilis]|uniref:HAD-IA family hydrolase n=1 Tax=Ampullimonas aquatilis TaxID=1341549 RepID=UPI003C707F8C